MFIAGQEITNVAVIGLGLTGRSCVRFLQSKGLTPTLYDTREQLDCAEVATLAPNSELHLGALDSVLLSRHQILLVSPGITIAQPAIEAAKAQGTLIWGDVELFAHFVRAPVVAITGSNGKTTVTSLLAAMAKNAGVKAVAIGNIGLPVLDVVDDSSIELFIIELSSFQLETTHSLELCAATVLNISDDHMDRYNAIADYAQAKQRIYAHAKRAIVNRQDVHTLCQNGSVTNSFGTDKPDGETSFGLVDDALYQGETCLLPVGKMAMIGQHNQLNALAALALGQQAGLDMTAMLDTLTTFSGLAHRCALVPSSDGIRWLNDSKATNVGATLAAIDGLKENAGQLIVIAGGDAKGGDLTPLAKPFAEHVAHLIVIGRDQQLFCDIYPAAYRQETLEAAVSQAASLTKAGATVLLSPSCASLDMFDNYMARGQAFIDAVEGLYV